MSFVEKLKSLKLKDPASKEEAAREVQVLPPPCPDVGWVAAVRHSWTRTAWDSVFGHHDLSDEYHDVLRQVEAGLHRLAQHNDLVYMIVPGLFCNTYPVYFDGTVDHLKAIGLDVRRAKIDTGASVATNASTIAQQVNSAHTETGKKVLLVGHSKGGCDAVAAVSRNKELQSKVAGVLTLQSPLGGTPIADDLERGALRKFVNEFIKNVLKGEVSSLTDLTYAKRRQELAEHPFPIHKVPIVTFSSRTRRPLSALKPLADFFDDRYDGLATDGMVASPDADLPDSKRVFFNRDWDHGNCAFFEPGVGHTKDELVNEAAIYLLVRQTDSKADPKVDPGKKPMKLPSQKLCRCGGCFQFGVVPPGTNM